MGPVGARLPIVQGTSFAFVPVMIPAVADVLNGIVASNRPASVRLVQGSHIVVPRLFEHDRCYIFQNADGRIIFAIPYETDFTLIGTTDQEHDGAPHDAVCTPEEQDYLTAFASRYFKRPVTRDDIVWTYSGIRPLYDDHAANGSAVTRDYVLDLDGGDGRIGRAAPAGGGHRRARPGRSWPAGPP